MFRTIRSDEGELAAVDLVDLGARSGLLWRSPGITLVGLGSIERVSVARPGGGGEAQAILTAMTHSNELEGVPGTGAIAFAALPFDRARTGELLVPPVVVGSNGADRWVTTREGVDWKGVVDDLLLTPDPSAPSRIVVRTGVPAAEWRDRVVRATSERIRSSALQKAVMARRITLTADSSWQIRPIVCSLADRFPDAMVFAIDGFVGASPELLVARNEREVRALPLAGTAGRADDAQIDEQLSTALFESTKNRDEHRITIDWLLTELLRYCSYIDAEPEPSVLSMANVHHLATRVEGVLSEPPASILDLVAAVHPTPAVGGDPQDRALELIAELEECDRGRYGGPAGWVDAAGNGEFAVSVRTAQLDGSKALVWAGVGVLADSDPDAELEETQAKFKAILGTLLGPVAFGLLTLINACSSGPGAASDPADLGVDELNAMLIEAAWDDDVDAARDLVAAGADVNYKDQSQQSAYLISTSEGYFDLLELTFEHGADVESLDGYNGTGLIRAAERGHANVVARLLETEIDVDHVNNLGWTALHEAIILGDGSPRYVQTVRLLIDAGADVTLASRRDDTSPLEHAVARGQDEIVDLLRAAIADEG